MVSYQNRLNSHTQSHSEMWPRCVSGAVAGGHLFETAVPGAEASPVKAEVTLYKKEEQMSGPTVPPAQSLRLQVRFLRMVQPQSPRVRARPVCRNWPCLHSGGRPASAGSEAQSILWLQHLPT